MKILLATPLYPPEIAPPAPYAKELAWRLNRAGHEVTVLAYTHLPEEIPGVRIVSVSKRQPLLLRLAHFTHALMREVRHTDLSIIVNGASVELPFLFVSFFTKVPALLSMQDEAAYRHAKQSALYGFLERATRRWVQTVLSDMLPARPEILPFAPVPSGQQETFEGAWGIHLHTITHTAPHGT